MMISGYFPFILRPSDTLECKKGSSFADGLVEPPRGDESKYKFKNKPP